MTDNPATAQQPPAATVDATDEDIDVDNVAMSAANMASDDEREEDRARAVSWADTAVAANITTDGDVNTTSTAVPLTETREITDALPMAIMCETNAAMSTTTTHSNYHSVVPSTRTTR